MTKSIIEILQGLTPLELAVGSGVTFPIKITHKPKRVWDSVNKKVIEVNQSGWYPKMGNTDLIKHNLETALLYPKGFRLREEDYGNTLESIIEEPNTQALKFYITNAIRTIIGNYESRITFKEVQTRTNGATVVIRIHYTINTEQPIDDYLDLYMINND